MTSPRPAPLVVGALGRCPRCGAPGLFAGLVRFAPGCRACSLDFSVFNVGDGAVPFLVFVVGAVAVIGAVWLQLGAHPPFWVHLILWPPVVVALTIVLTRIAKGVLLALEYRHQAGEGRA